MQESEKKTESAPPTSSAAEATEGVVNELGAAPDASQDPRAAQEGPMPDGFNLAHANETQRAMIAFKSAIEGAAFKGHEAQAVSIGLMLVSNMIAQGKAQIAFFSRGIKGRAASVPNAEAKAKNGKAAPTA